MTTTSLIQDQNVVEFKADFFPITVIKLTTVDPAAIKNQIVTTILTAPHYFKDAPVVIDVHSLSETSDSMDLTSICQLLRQQKMIPVGIRGLDKSQEETALSQGLAIMKTPKSEKKKQPSLMTGKVAVKTETTTKIISSPIRAGQQVYARQSDLIITAAVNAGGECIADGNIHIYGPLRGKALAGANGNEKARIFCESLEAAELVSIAGHYVTNEKLVIPKTEKPMIQIYLKDGRIQLDSI